MSNELLPIPEIIKKIGLLKVETISLLEQMREHLQRNLATVDQVEDAEKESGKFSFKTAFQIGKTRGEIKSELRKVEKEILKLKEGAR